MDASLEKEIDTTSHSGSTYIRHSRMKNMWMMLLYFFLATVAMFSLPLSFQNIALSGEILLTIQLVPPTQIRPSSDCIKPTAELWP